MGEMFLKYRNCCFYRVLWFILLCGTYMAQAQDTPGAKINKIISTVNTYTQNQAVEKIYLQTDKTFYNSGDTLWFKGYLFDAARLNSSIKSGILYVEIVSDSNRVVKRIMVPVYSGLAWGDMELDGNDMPPGGYTLRSYTSWMRNFPEDLIFKKRFFISGITKRDWLIDYNAHIKKETGKDNMQLNLRINQLDKTPVLLREVQLRLTDNRRTWFKDNVQTDMGGELKVDFNLPEKINARTLLLSIEDLSKGDGGRKVLIPVPLNRPENIDLQFMPEGGNLVGALPANVAFKALNEDGLSVNVAGFVYDSKGQKVAAFNTAHKGMGNFKFIPAAGEIYHASIKLPDGSFKIYPLPAVAASGLTMQVNNPFKGDSCEVMIRATPDIANTGTIYYLIAQAKGLVYYGASFGLVKGFVRVKINKHNFPGGIVRFILTGTDNVALKERRAFNHYYNNLNIALAGNKTIYRQRDSIALNITVTDVNGAPVQGSFSLAVTDDGMVKTDRVNSDNMVTRLLLTDELKGTVEDPGYYADMENNAEKWTHTDQLLLTQGWVGYDWEEAFKPAKKVIYGAEPEFLIKGRVTNMFNKPVARAGLTLYSKKPFLITDTVSNEQGAFTFKGIRPSDTAAFFIQAKNKRGKSFNVGIEMDEFVPPVYTALSGRTIPWYVNMDTSDFSAVKKQVKLVTDRERMTKGIVLKVVEVKAKKIIRGSKNLNGTGEADVIIDEEELKKAGRVSLGDLLEKRVKGFSLVYGKFGIRNYKVQGLLVHLIIDGAAIDFFYDGSILRYLFYKQYLDYYDAEEIKGIEVMTSGKYQLAYAGNYNLNPFYEHAFIEVTTRSGSGPFLKKAVGTYLYKPMALTLPKNFYSPKYKAGATADMTDIRSTIYWEPNIITGKDGRAAVTFFTSDNPGTYNWIIEGSDMDGSIGTRQGRIEVKKGNL